MQTEHDYISQKEIEEFLDRLEVISEKLHDEIVKSVIDATIGAIRKLIRLAKKQNVVPVRHGRWIPKNTDGSWRVETCSECKKDTHYVRFAPAYDYCPNCGAVMYKDGDGDV